MRKLALAAALATTAIASPALARDDAWYIGAHGGAMMVEDVDIDVLGSTGADATAEYNTGFDVDGVIGYDFGMFRLETEVGFRRAWTDNVAYVGVNSTRGNVRSLSFMLNGLLDFGPDDGLQGFVGGGAGVARTHLYSLTTDDSDTGFAWQALAGVRLPLSENLDAELKYRFFNHRNLDLVTSNAFNGVGAAGSAVDADVRTHSLLVGLVYNFGEKAPPPPPPPPVVECQPGPYIVFFEFDKSDITPDAATILDSAVSAYANCNNAQVMLAGHADKAGRPAYNVALSQRRADAAKAYIVSKGIADSAIATKAFGEGQPKVETADGVRELQNRRVEITYGPGSGM